MASVSVRELLPLFSLLSIALVAPSLVSSHQFQVGGDRGWKNTNPTGNYTQSYNSWAAQNRFHVGDTLCNASFIHGRKHLITWSEVLCSLNFFVRFSQISSTETTRFWWWTTPTTETAPSRIRSRGSITEAARFSDWIGAEISISLAERGRIVWLGRNWWCEWWTIVNRRKMEVLRRRRRSRGIGGLRRWIRRWRRRWRRISRRRLEVSWLFCICSRRDLESIVDWVVAVLPCFFVAIEFPLFTFHLNSLIWFGMWNFLNQMQLNISMLWEIKYVTSKMRKISNVKCVGKYFLFYFN